MERGYSIAATLSGQDLLPLGFGGRYYVPKIPVLDKPYQDCRARSPRLMANTRTAYPLGGWFVATASTRAPRA